MVDYQSNKTIRNIIISLAILIWLSGCSGRNVVGDFDCPVDKGKSCIKIKEADKIARSKLESKEGKSYNSSTVTDYNKENKGKEKYNIIKFAPYKDKDGNYHQSSEVVYVD